MSDNQEMRKPPELEFLEMIRNLPATLPDFLLAYQRNENTEDAHLYREWLNQWNGRVLNAGEAVPPMVFSDAALAVMFHHIAMETFVAYERLDARITDSDSDENSADLSAIKSIPVRNFWSRFVQARKERRTTRANEILEALTPEDREALIQAGVRFSPFAQRKTRQPRK